MYKKYICSDWDKSTPNELGQSKFYFIYDLCLLLQDGEYAECGKQIKRKIESHLTSLFQSNQKEFLLYWRSFVEMNLIWGKRDEASRYFEKYSQNLFNESINLFDSSGINRMTTLMLSLEEYLQLDIFLNKMVEQKGIGVLFGLPDSPQVTCIIQRIYQKKKNNKEVIEKLKKSGYQSIHFLTKIGEYGDAKELERIIDSDYFEHRTTKSGNEKHLINNDEFYSKIIDIQWKSTSALEFTNYLPSFMACIKNEMIRTDKLYRGILYYHGMNDHFNEDRLVAQYIQLTNEMSSSDTHIDYFLVDLLLRIEKPNLARKAIEKIKGISSINASWYKLGLFHVLHYDIINARSCLKKIDIDSAHKGLLLSKIASIELCLGDSKSSLKDYIGAISSFRKKYDMSLETYIEKILRDYVRATKKKEIVDSQRYLADRILDMTEEINFDSDILE
jgi:hypothetical protein